MSKTQDMQKAIHHYRQVTGIDDADMLDVAKFAVETLGMELPEPIDPIERLARQMARAAREETARDSETGRHYRVNHAVPVEVNGQLRFKWFHIDRIPRAKMRMSLVHRRDQMIGDATMLKLDADHWNRVHKAEEPIQIPLDFESDVAERLALDDAEDDAG